MPPLLNPKLKINSPYNLKKTAVNSKVLSTIGVQKIVSRRIGVNFAKSEQRAAQVASDIQQVGKLNRKKEAISFLRQKYKGLDQRGAEKVLGVFIEEKKGPTPEQIENFKKRNREYAKSQKLNDVGSLGRLDKNVKGARGKNARELMRDKNRGIFGHAASAIGQNGGAASAVKSANKSSSIANHDDSIGVTGDKSNVVALARKSQLQTRRWKENEHGIIKQAA